MSTDTITRRIYVACLGSYNEGRLHGRWIEASSDVDELNEQVQAMLSESKLDFGRKAEEYAIHDYEGYPDGLVGEYSGIAFIAELEEALERVEDSGRPVAAFLAYHANDPSGDITDKVSSFEEAYQGQWESGADYAEEFYRSTGQITDDSPLESYVDWSRVWVGDFACASHWISDEGYVFNGALG